MSTYTVLLTAMSIAVAGGAHSERPWPPVGLESFGSVRYGMTLRQAAAALGEALPLGPDQLGIECTSTSAASMPDHAWFMVVDSMVVRIDVYTDSLETDRGARVGMTETQVQSLYDHRLVVQPHPYTAPDGHYLILDPDPADSTGPTMIFETLRDTVRNFRAGRKPAVLWIEGCS
jgi:hypothetical protein